MDLGRGRGSSCSGAGAGSGAGVGVAAAGVSDRPSCTAAPPCDFLFLVACSFLAAARAGSFRFFSIATDEDGSRLGWPAAKCALLRQGLIGTGAPGTGGRRRRGVSSSERAARVVSVAARRGDRGPMDGVWTGSWAGWKCRENGLTKVGRPPQENGMGLGGTGTGAGRQDRQGALGTGLGHCPSGWCGHCGAGLARLQGADWTGGPRPSLKTGSFSVELVTCRRERVRDDARWLMLGLLGGGMATGLMAFWLLPSSGILIRVQEPPKSVALGKVAES